MANNDVVTASDGRAAGTRRQFPTVVHALAANRVEFASKLAIRSADGHTAWTWAGLADRVAGLAAGLRDLGVKPGDTVALMFHNIPEFFVADLAVLSLAATPFSIYNTSAPDQIRYLLKDSGATMAICEEQFAGLLRGSLDRVVVAGTGRVDGCLPFDEVAGNSVHELPCEYLETLPDTVATIIYTSGTTGPPKGVELTHRNVMSSARAFSDVVGFDSSDSVISWLPDAHIGNRLTAYYIPALIGMEVTCCPETSMIVEVLEQVRPTQFCAVPRIWEKLRDKAMTRAPGAHASSGSHAFPGNVEEPPVAAAALQVRRVLGLDRCRAPYAASAPISSELMSYFKDVGVVIGELWGLSEVTGVGTLNPPDAVRYGTVGLPLPGLEVAIRDGEIAVRGPMVMRGYRNRPEETAQTLGSDGWLATGDLGEWDEQHYLKLVGRKKDIIINSSGKNMSAANIENAIKSASPTVAHAIVVGDARPYITALILLELTQMEAGRQSRRDGDAERDAALDGDAVADSDAAAVIEHVTSLIRRANKGLSRVEQVKRFAVIAGAWDQPGELLTPTMKLRRSNVLDRYGDIIDTLYSASAGTNEQSASGSVLYGVA
jgi:long-chain acyl-CoA synthetase